MNKKNLVSALFTLTFTCQAFAWDFGFAKGDDPKIIADVVNSLKHAATQVSNATRDAIGSVGNATGITNIIDSNRKTLADIGTAYACVATLCYSEVIKKTQLEELEQEQKARLDAEVAQLNIRYAKRSCEVRAASSRMILEQSERILKTLKEQLKISKIKRSNNSKTLKALNTQIIWNDAMAKQQVSGRPNLAKTDMKQVASKFEENFNYDFGKSVDQLNADLLELEKVTKVRRSELMSDLIYTLSDATLRNFAAELEKDRLDIESEIIAIDEKMSDFEAQRQAAGAVYALENQGAGCKL